VPSVAGSGGYGQRGLPEFGLSEKEQQALWERFATLAGYREPRLATSRS